MRVGFPLLTIIMGVHGANVSEVWMHSGIYNDILSQLPLVAEMVQLSAQGKR